VARLLRANATAYTQTSARPILVIAMSPGVSHGPWAQALASPDLRDNLVPFTVAGPDEAAGLADLDFNAATWSDVAPAALRAHVDQVALLQALYANGKVTVNIRRLTANEAPAKTQVDVPLMQTVGTTYPAAAEAALRAIDDMWKARSVIDTSQRGRITADLRVASLPQWGQMQGQLAGIHNITGVSVVAMNMSYARLSIAYVGNVDQLRDALGQSGMTLAGRGNQWQISAQ
jgi:hypothetical protein